MRFSPFLREKQKSVSINDADAEHLTRSRTSDHVISALSLLIRFYISYKYTHEAPEADVCHDSV